jgi:hypothetical protein
MESIYLNGGMNGVTLDFSANTRYPLPLTYDDAITGSSGGTPEFRWKFNNSTAEEASYSTTVNGTFSYGSALIPTITDVSADFDGSTTYLVPANSTLINTGTFTKRSVSFWFNADTTGSGTYPCIWEEGGGTNWFSIYLDNGLIYANLGEGNTTGGHATASVSTGTTYHCLVTVDLSLGSNNIKIYLNGALAGQATSSIGTDLAAHAGDNRIGFGAARNHLNTNNPYSVYDGRLQDLCYWYEDALTLSDASDIYAAGTTVLNLQNSGIWNLEAVYDSLVAPIYSYRYYRWDITAIRGGGADSNVQVADFYFTLNGSDVTMSGSTATNVAGSSPGGEGPSNLVDSNSSTKWLNLNGISGDIQIDFGSVTDVNGYRWVTANDADWRDPISWVLQGSNDGTNWENLDTRTSESITTSRFTSTSIYEIQGA